MRLAALLVGAVTAAFTATPAYAADGSILGVGTDRVVPDSYVVVLKSDVDADAAQKSLLSRFGGKAGQSWRAALKGFELNASEAVAKQIAGHPSVSYVQRNGIYTIQDTQPNPPSWGLDRIDQPNLPLNNSYTYPNTASNVRAYIVDTGIRITHTDFGGRAVWGHNAVDTNNTDCHGHGTHVAGTTGGGAYGVAKGVALVAVKVLNCSGSGTTAQVVGGINFVTSDHDPGELAIANMSLGGGVDTAIDNAVTASIADGVTYAIAAGNSNANACNFSPARVPAAITLGASDINDARASFSNFGTCLDLFAPGVNITSAWATSDTATNTISGTSMASPHAAGAAALILSANPGFTPQQVRDAMVAAAVPNKITSPGTGSPNLLLQVGPAAPPTQDFSIAVSPGSGTVAAGSSGTATVTVTTTVGAGQTVNLSASGVPSGVTASFAPASGTSTFSSTLTLSVAANKPDGTHAITITGTGTSGTKSTTFTLTTTGGPVNQCNGTNAADVAVPDSGTAYSDIALACNRNGSATATVEVHILHTYRGDLRIRLQAPDGTLYLLKNANPFDSADNVHATYTVNLSGEAGAGTWRLRVDDVFSADTGFIDTWTLNI
jgi:subtilisin family serine protease